MVVVHIPKWANWRGEPCQKMWSSTAASRCYILQFGFLAVSHKVGWLDIARKFDSYQYQRRWDGWALQDWRRQDSDMPNQPVHFASAVIDRGNYFAAWLWVIRQQCNNHWADARIRMDIWNFKVYHPQKPAAHWNVLKFILCFICRGAKVPDPPEGHRWKEVRHDNTVSRLSSWESFRNHGRCKVIN